MAPINEKNFNKNKCQENCDGKQKFFSFRWLLKKSKSSKFSKEMTPAENSQPLVVSSKSYDAALTSFEAVDKCPTFLLWKFLPPTGKSLSHSRSSNVCVSSGKSGFKTSFSCSDVYGMVTKDAFGSVEGKQGLSTLLENQDPDLKSPSQSCCRLNKADSSSTYFDTFTKSLDVNSGSAHTNPLHNVLCKLCLSMVPAKKMYTLQDCYCVFCITCLKQYLMINVKEGNVTVTCPDANCSSSGKILASEIQEIAGDEALLTFERFKLNRDVELDPNRVWCPAPGCETICTFEPPANPIEGVPVACFKCKIKFCSSCKLRWHSGKICNDVKRSLSDEIEFSMSEEENLIKRCPNCRVPIEKDEGCAQMMCYRCKHVFCWHCLASLDDDFLLRHYDKGPCRNKLGHSRASMIWHRTQVVGIFAGFSFLLLMASPFLLLAAPCLICCRCKHKFFYEEATPL